MEKGLTEICFTPSFVENLPTVLTSKSCSFPFKVVFFLNYFSDFTVWNYLLFIASATVFFLNNHFYLVCFAMYGKIS